MSVRFIVALFVVSGFGALITFLLFFYRLPGTSAFWYSVQNTGHSVLFFSLFFVIAFMFSCVSVHIKKRRTQLAVAVLVICIVIGALTEILQGSYGRKSSWFDFALDITGASIAALLYIARFNTKKRIKTICFVGIVCLSCFAIFEPAKYKIAEINRDKKFPIIADFENIWLNMLIFAHYEADIYFVDAPVDWREKHHNGYEKVAKIVFNQGIWPGIYFQNLNSDWQSYEFVSFEIFNPYKETLFLRMKIQDRQHNNMGEDRFKQRLTIKPGANMFNISLDEVKSAPKGREMNLDDISMMVIYQNKPKQAFELYFDNFKLH